MAKLDLDDIARRLRAVRAELGKTVPALAAEIGASKSALYTWEAGSQASKPNFPSEEAMASLCELQPGLTLDYLYRGRVETMRPALAIRLLAREMGMDPDAPDFDRSAALRAWDASQPAG